MEFSKLKSKQIETEIARVVGEVHGYFDWRAQQWLGVQLPNVTGIHYQHTPLALSLRAIFDHVTSANPQPDTVRDSCQLACEALFVAPGSQGGNYEIPAEFWDTLTGQAIQAVLGARPELPDDAIIESAVACEIAGVTRETLRNWRELGKLVPVDQGGETGGFRYRAGDVRKL
jgi:hypothetical protein